MSFAPDRRTRTRALISVIVESFIATAVLLALYYVVPTPGSIVLASVACAVVFLGVVGFELRAILKDPRPVPRAVVAMGRVLPLFIVMFAWLYVAISVGDPRTFSEPLTRSASLYFTITVLSTVGFGDITPLTDAARLLVAVQMLCDLVVIVIVVKLITGVAKHRVQQTTVGSEKHDPTGSG
jgi:voltage-gated potassium channel